MSAIMMSQLTVTDREAFQDYLVKSKELAGSYGAELLYRGKLTGALNGEPHRHQMVVIAKFPDMAAIEAWHKSPEYQALVPLREKGSEQLMTTYESVE